MIYGICGDDALNLDLSDTANRSPGMLPTGTPAKRSSPFLPRLPKSTQALFDQIRAKAKQALPAAPAAVPPTAPAFKLGLLGWGLLGVEGYLLLFRKKEKKNG
jgi:hypothetical protein